MSAQLTDKELRAMIQKFNRKAETTTDKAAKVVFMEYAFACEVALAERVQSLAAQRAERFIHSAKAELKAAILGGKLNDSLIDSGLNIIKAAEHYSADAATYDAAGEQVLAEASCNSVGFMLEKLRDLIATTR
jgi:hypothetical protein